MPLLLQALSRAAFEPMNAGPGGRLQTPEKRRESGGACATGWQSGAASGASGSARDEGRVREAGRAVEERRAVARGDPAARGGEHGVAGRGVPLHGAAEARVEVGLALGDQ